MFFDVKKKLEAVKISENKEESTFDTYKSEHAVAFINELKHTKGIWHGLPFNLLPWQEQIIRDIFGTIKPDGYRQFNTAYVEVPKKNGKQLSLDTPIPTLIGGKLMGEIRLGDKVFDEKGHVCNVVAISETDDTEQAYKLFFADGNNIIAGERHLWLVENANSCFREKLMATGEMFNNQLVCDGNMPFRIPVKNQSQLLDNCIAVDDHHYIERIEKAGRTEMRCIQVDSPSRLYLAGLNMVPTHNSELAAAIALYLTCGDGEWGSEVYGCAADRQQASIVFDVAVGMVEQCPSLRKRIKPILSQKRLVFTPLNSFYQVLSAEAYTKHGLNIHGVVFDEIHAQPNRDLYDVMMHGSGDARKQPLYFLITTAGYDRNSICWEVHEKAVDILSGRKVNPSFYPVIYCAGDDEDWASRDVWARVNPSLGHIIDIEKLEGAFLNAKDNAAEENLFRQLRLNQWVKQSVRWMQMEKWDTCSFPVDAKELEGRACYAGLDLSSTMDITAFVLVFPPESNDDKYVVLPYFWIPEENIQTRVRRDHVPYDIWEQQGFLNTTEGNVVHYDFIEAFIEDLGTRYDIQEIAFDRWGAI